MSCNHTYHGSMIPPTDGSDFTIFAYIGGLIPNANYSINIKDKDGNVYTPINGTVSADENGQFDVQIDSQDVDFPPGFFVVPGQEYELYIVDVNNNHVDFLALQQYDKIRFKIVGGNGEFPVITRVGCVCSTL